MMRPDHGPAGSTFLGVLGDEDRRERRLDSLLRLDTLDDVANEQIPAALVQLAAMRTKLAARLVQAVPQKTPGNPATRS